MHLLDADGQPIKGTEKARPVPMEGGAATSIPRRRIEIEDKAIKILAKVDFSEGTQVGGKHREEFLGMLDNMVKAGLALGLSLMRLALVAQTGEAKFLREAGGLISATLEEIGGTRVLLEHGIANLAKGLSPLPAPEGPKVQAASAAMVPPAPPVKG